MKRYLFVAILALVSLATHSASASTGEEQKVFFEAIESISPASAASLRALGGEYKQKCGAEPTVAQYQVLASETEAYAFRQSIVAMGAGDDASKWPAEAQTRYQALLDKVACLK